MCPGFCALKRPQRNHRTPAGIGARSGRIYNPPLRENRERVRRAGCPHPAKPGSRDHRPAIIGTWSWRHEGMPPYTHSGHPSTTHPGGKRTRRFYGPAPRSSRRGRCPHRPASRRVQSTSPTAKAPSLPLVTKVRWHGEAVTEGIRTGSDRGLTIPQSRCA